MMLQKRTDIISSTDSYYEIHTYYYCRSCQLTLSPLLQTITPLPHRRLKNKEVIVYATTAELLNDPMHPDSDCAVAAYVYCPSPMRGSVKLIYSMFVNR